MAFECPFCGEPVETSALRRDWSDRRIYRHLRDCPEKPIVSAKT